MIEGIFVLPLLGLQKTLNIKSFRPNIMLGAFIYCMFRPQFSKIYANENHFLV
jgi:hypothetical protein